MLRTRKIRLVLLSLVVAMSGLDLSGLAPPLETVTAESGVSSITVSGFWRKGASLRRDLQFHDELDESAAVVDPDPDALSDGDFLLTSSTGLLPKLEVQPWSDAGHVPRESGPHRRLFRPPRVLVS
jgi:hypothetical protein